MRDDLRNAPGLIDLSDPFRQRAEHAAVVDFLEGVAAGMLERDLAHEQQQRRAVLHRGVDADRAVTGARAARDERGGGPAGQLSVGFRHIHGPGLEPAGDQLQLLPDVVQAIEHGQETLAGDGKDVIDPLRDQRVRQDAPAHAFRPLGLAGLCQSHHAHPRPDIVPPIIHAPTIMSRPFNGATKYETEPAPSAICPLVPTGGAGCARSS